MRNEIIDLVNQEFKKNNKEFFLTCESWLSVLDQTKKIFKKFY